MAAVCLQEKKKKATTRTKKRQRRQRLSSTATANSMTTMPLGGSPELAPPSRLVSIPTSTGLDLDTARWSSEREEGRGTRRGP